MTELTHSLLLLLSGVADANESGRSPGRRIAGSRRDVRQRSVSPERGRRKRSSPRPRNRRGRRGSDSDSGSSSDRGSRSGSDDEAP